MSGKAYVKIASMVALADNPETSFLCLRSVHPDVYQPSEVLGPRRSQKTYIPVKGKRVLLMAHRVEDARCQT